VEEAPQLTVKKHLYTANCSFRKKKSDMSGVFNGESTSLHHSNLSLQTICGAKLSWLRERSQIPVCFRLMTAMWLSVVDYKIPITITVLVKMLVSITLSNQTQILSLTFMLGLQYNLHLF